MKSFHWMSPIPWKHVRRKFRACVTKANKPIPYLSILYCWFKLRTYFFFVCCFQCVLSCQMCFNMVFVTLKCLMFDYIWNSMDSLHIWEIFRRTKWANFGYWNLCFRSFFCHTVAAPLHSVVVVIVFWWPVWFLKMYSGFEDCPAFHQMGNLVCENC